MPKDTPRTDAARDAEPLADLVYRPRLSTGNKQVRNANPLIALPLTLLGYLALGFLGWQIVQHSRTLLTDVPKTIAVDLLDLSEGEAVTAPPPAAGAPPPGAIERPDAPPPPLPASPDAVPDQPPAELPTQDLSGVAFPSWTPKGTNPEAGTSEGSGTSPGLGGGGPKIVDFDYQQIKVLFWPPKPPYPELASKARVQGTVKVEVIVDVHGIPASVRAVEGPMMLRATSEAYASKMRFQPETENGVPVSARFWLTMPYSLQTQ